MPPESPTIAQLIDAYEGRPIRNCPGRYILNRARTQMPPSRIVGEHFRQTVYEETPAKDKVIVTWIENWGLISFHRKDGSWCHTVNEPDGFARKLKALEIFPE